jgi:hypothetical protein
MTRKYIDDLGIKFENTPQGWCPNDPREDKWKKEEEIYGFDSRETWALDYNFKLWLYERLSMYNEINIVDTSFHKFEYKNETITFQDCIDRMIAGLKLDLTIDEFDSKKKDLKVQEAINDVLPIFQLCFNCLWW